jgi:hypothetical protein
MAETVNVPGIGKTKTIWVVAGGAAILGIVAYAYMRRASLQEPPLGEGMPTPGDQWSPDAYSGAGTPGGESFDPQDVSPDPNAPPATNAQWTQRVVDWLVNVAQYDSQFAANTIGKYLSGNTLNAGEKLLVQAGVGALGSPPAGALPIISGPEPTVPPKPRGAPRLVTGWHGHRMQRTTSWRNVAIFYANYPTQPNSVEGTVRQIIQMNPLTYKQDKMMAHKGWIVLVPLPTTRKITGKGP